VKSDIIIQLHKNFEGYAHQIDGEEFLFARDLQGLLGYTLWRNFEQVIDKARIACRTVGHVVSDHFADVSKTKACRPKSTATKSLILTSNTFICEKRK